MNAFEAALEVLRRCRQGLASEPSPEERERLLALLADAAALLEATGRRRLASVALAERVRDLEHALRDRDPGERRAIVCERLGISRSRFYQLRRACRTDCTLA